MRDERATAGGGGPMSKVEITIEIDDSRLSRYDDSYLAMLWHVAQANPAPHGDRGAGELVEHIGREIIRRWLGSSQPELWHHQGRDHYWHKLCQLGKWDKAGVFTLRTPDSPPR